MGKKTDELVIIGSGDSWIAELVDVARAHGLGCLSFTPDGFADEQLFSLDGSISDLGKISDEQQVFLGYQVAKDLEELPHPRRVQRSRQLLLELASVHRNFNWATLIHPSAWVSPSAKVEEGVFVGANSSIGANTGIGRHCTINRNVSIGHNVSIGLGVEISPMSAISSGSTLGNWSFIGPGATILNDIQIGENAVVGAGSVVTRNVDPGSTVMGIPATAAK